MRANDYPSFYAVGTSCEEHRSSHDVPASRRRPSQEIDATRER